VCRWKQIIISRSWNWTHLQFSTQCSNGCQCVLCNFQWFLFSIMSVTVLYLNYLGGPLFRDTVYTVHAYVKNIYIAPRINSHWALRSHHTNVNRHVLSLCLDVRSGAWSAGGRPFHTWGPEAEKRLSLNHLEVWGMRQVLMSEERSLRRSASGDGGVSTLLVCFHWEPLLWHGMCVVIFSISNLQMIWLVFC